MTLVLEDEGSFATGDLQPDSGTISISAGGVLVFGKAGYNASHNSEAYASAVAELNDSVPNAEAFTLTTTRADTDVIGMAGYLLNPQLDGIEIESDIIDLSSWGERSYTHYATFGSDDGGTISFADSDDDYNPTNSDIDLVLDLNATTANHLIYIFGGVYSNSVGPALTGQGQTVIASTDFTTTHVGYRQSGHAYKLGNAGPTAGRVELTNGRYSVAMAIAFLETGGGGGASVAAQRRRQYYGY